MKLINNNLQSYQDLTTDIWSNALDQIPDATKNADTEKDFAQSYKESLRQETGAYQMPRDMYTEVQV